MSLSLHVIHRYISVCANYLAHQYNMESWRAVVCHMKGWPRKSGSHIKSVQITHLKCLRWISQRPPMSHIRHCWVLPWATGSLTSPESELSVFWFLSFYRGLSTWTILQWFSSTLMSILSAIRHFVRITLLDAGCPGTLNKSLWLQLCVLA